MVSTSLAPVTETLNGTGYYVPSEAARIARVPVHSLHAWRRRGIVVPTIRWIDELEHEQNGYSFNGIVYLRLIKMLRDARVSLEKSVEVVYHLTARFGPPSTSWEEARIFRYGRDIDVYGKDEWRTTVATKGGQKAWDELFGEEFIQLRDRADALLIPTRYQRYVEIDPHVRDGLPVVRATTIQTNLMHALRLQGQTHVEIQQDYPVLTLPQVKGADAYESFLDAEALAA